jgi:hypothetical protein
MAKPDFDFEELNHKYLTEKLLKQQVAYWFPELEETDYYVEMVWPNKGDKGKTDKQLVRRKTKEYIGWFNQALLIPYRPPIPMNKPE